MNSKKLYDQNWLLVAGFFTAGLFLALFFAVIAIAYVHLFKEAKSLLVTETLKEVIQNLGFAFAGMLSVCGVIVANRRAKAMEHAAESQAEAVGSQAKAVESQAEAVRVTEAGQRQERFRDAVSHLGHKSESVRLGGIYALFQMALEDEAGKIRKDVADILCAHIRSTTRSEAYQVKYGAKPSTEIQSLLRMLFTAKTSKDVKDLEKFWDGIEPDLTGGYFHGLELHRARFERALLEGAQFHGADLFYARFHDASLRRVKFHSARFYDAQFHGAALMDAEFYGATLSGIKFYGANLWDAKFYGANFWNAEKTQGVYLKASQFQGAYLRGTQFQGAHFGDAEFHGAYSQGDRDPSPFVDKIKNRRGEESDLSGVVFSGGLNEAQMEKIVAEWRRLPYVSKEDTDKPTINKEFINRFKNNMSVHVGKKPSHTLPTVLKKSVGSYDEQKAEKWIQEYNEVTKTTS